MPVFTVMNTLDSGKGSLRQAILKANLTSESDTIEFDSSLVGNVIELSSGQLTITNSLTINGLGASSLTINAGKQGWRVFNIDDGTTNLIDVSINGLTITGGNPEDDGGGIRSVENLTVKNSVISGNTIVAKQDNIEENLDGGGIYGRSGTLTISNSIVTNNSLEGEKKSGEFKGDDLDGGGVAVWEGKLTIKNSTISGNVVSAGLADGGGIYTWKSDLMVSNSTISGNKVESSAIAAGGGIASYYNFSAYSSSEKKIVTGTSTISHSTISDNSIFVDQPFNADGGGLFVGHATLTVSNSTISGNKAFQLDGQAGSNDGGGMYARDSQLTLTNSTISGNSASRGGGGIAVGTTDLKGTLKVSNSTISGNVAGYRGGGLYSRSSNHVTTINNSTIFANKASEGSGIYQQGLVELASNIIANHSNAHDLIGSFSSNGNNLIGNGEGNIGLKNGINGDLVGTTARPVAPLLGPLEDNGGFLTGAEDRELPILTHALLPGSPAINAGSNPNLLLSDQRGVGFAREVGFSPDIGSYELQENHLSLTTIPLIYSQPHSLEPENLFLLPLFLLFL